MNDIVIYYQKRAEEYELVYQKTERQSDLSAIKKYLIQQFIDKSIIEIACGTGYWTEILSKNSRFIHAIDISSRVLSIAKKKSYPRQNVKYEIKDIRSLKSEVGEYEGLFGGFIWSHIPKEENPNFLKMAMNQAEAGAEIIFLDNKYVEASSTPISRTDKNGNTYQNRVLKSGEQFEVLKNFPRPTELESLAKATGLTFEWVDFQYYWIAKFKKQGSVFHK